MTERRVDLKAGQRVIVRGPDAPGKYVSVPSVTLAPGDSAIVSVAASPPPPPEPEPTPDVGPSGIAIPTVKNGWRRSAASDFLADIPFGQWNGDPEGALMGRASGYDTSRRGIYRLSEISQHDSLLDCRMRQLADGSRVMGCPMNKAPNPSNDSATAPFALRVTTAMRVLGPVAGWKIAHMLAKYGAVRPQEIDWPEVQLKDGATPSAWFHLLDGGSGKHFTTGVSLYEWHTYATEFVAGHYVQVELDGKVIGRVDDATLVGGDRVHWIGQNETQIGGTLPTQMGEAHVLFDWVTIDVPDVPA